MDLGSLLNQGSQGIDLDELRRILALPESSVKLDRITNPTFAFPESLHDTFDFFDVLIQILLSIEYNDEPFGPQYTMTIVVEALRACINGLLQQHGFSWLVQFPQCLSEQSWELMQHKGDQTVAIYLYGMVLALASQPDKMQLADWAASLSQFVKTKQPAIMGHIWMHLWSTDDVNHRDSKSVFFDILNDILIEEKSDRQPCYGPPLHECIQKMVSVLKYQRVSKLYSIDEKLGNVLWRPSFTVDDTIIAYAAFKMVAKRIASKDRLLSTVLMECHVLPPPSSAPPVVIVQAANPLLNAKVEAPLPHDAATRMKLLQDAALTWMAAYNDLGKEQFNKYLTLLIQERYPTDSKSMLDALVAYWTIRDPFNTHLALILNTFAQTLTKGSYNRRMSPYYAFIEYFRGWSEESAAGGGGSSEGSGYNITTGAEINVARFVQYGNPALLNGCYQMLKRLSKEYGEKTHGWVNHCLETAHRDIAKQYIAWLTGRVNIESDNNKDEALSPYCKLFIKVLANPWMLHLASDIAPVIMQTANDGPWMWLLKQPSARAIIVKYFSGFPDLSSRLLVTGLMESKSKIYMDHLLKALRKTMSKEQLTGPESRTWFSKHFMGPMVWMVGVGRPDDTCNAVHIFRLILKEPFYDFFLGTPLQAHENDISGSAFGALHIAKQHKIISVQNTGLVSMLHEIVQMRSKSKTSRIARLWSKMWLGYKNRSFIEAVPEDAVFQLIGLYDKAPAQVKQMIESFMQVGIRQGRDEAASRDNLRRGRSRDHQQPLVLQNIPGRVFARRMIDLMMLGDVSEVDTLYGMFARMYEQDGTDDEDDDIVFSMISIVLAIGEELQLAHKAEASLPPEPTLPEMLPEPAQVEASDPPAVRKQKRMVKKHRVMASKWQAMMKGRRDLQHQQTTMARQLLVVLSQRAIAFLTTVMEVEPEESPFKEIWRTKLTAQPLFYEALRSLRQAIQSDADVCADLQAFIDLCLARLSPQQADQARAVLRLND